MLRRRIGLLGGLAVVAGFAIAADYQCNDAPGTVGSCINLRTGNGSDTQCAGGGGGGGGGGAGTAVPTATVTPVPMLTPVPPTYWETFGGNYSYDSPCSGGTGDPVGTILIPTNSSFLSAQQRTDDRLVEIGMTSGFGSLPGGYSFTDRADFRDNGGCVEGSITRATNDGWHLCADLPYCVDPRWHTRCITHSQPSPVGYWASCTPHWDSPACGKHYVPAVYNGTENYTGSGYDAARDWTYYQLVNQYGMPFLGYTFFNNRAFRQHCNNERSRSDGKVNLIQLR